MESIDGSNYLSILSANLLRPIVTLWEELERKAYVAPNEVQTSPRENGYAAAVCVLLVIFAESVLVRTRKIMQDRGERTADGTREGGLDFLARVCANHELEKDALECFVLRDVIAHNHVWDAWVSETDGQMTHSSPPVRDASFGDSKFRSVLNESKMETRRLRLNIFPNRIDREDARKVLRTVYAVAEHFENKDRNYCDMTHEYVSFRGKTMKFADFVRLVCRPVRGRE